MSMVQAPISPPKVESALAFGPINLSPPTKINKGISEMLSKQHKPNLSDIVGSEREKYR